MNKIKFIVKIKESENPPRMIILERVSKDSEWVANKGCEGY
jgi:hypothetical protein